MTAERSAFVCATCGLVVGLWHSGTGRYWKHQAGGAGRGMSVTGRGDEAPGRHQGPPCGGP